jgi:biopolymer transport protein ExbD
MSHGGNVDIPEPNLTPLLDLVMQLLMFFLIVANFVVEQNNQDVQLPEATTAVPIDKEQKNVLSLNVDQNGRLVLSPTEMLDSDVQITRYLTDQFGHYKNERGSDKAAKEVAVVVRGDNRASFEHIYRVMRAAKDAGFQIVQLRANKPAVGGS